jgi:type I restriction enzyme R subunit
MSKYSWRAYLEDKDVIRDKAKDIIEHYVTSIFINGFKAQVVTASRLAAVRFKEALEISLKEKIEELKINNPYKVDVNKLKKVKVATIISGTLNDAPEFKQYTNPDKQEKEIKSFKLPFDYEKDGLTGDVGIIVVQSMLITGFDAPIEQVMYLDNVIKQHNLLQAIARVNRVYKNKNCGYVIDYVGVFNHIKEALSNYYEKDVNEILTNVTDKEHAKDKLAFTHNKIIEFFNIIGIRNYAEQAHECIDLLLADEKRRNEFYCLVNEFNRFMDIVLPDPYALKFKDALRTTNFIRETLRSILNQGISIKDASSKIREIVENYLISKGIRIKIEEVDILNPYFLEHLEAFKTPREKATATEISIRQYISDHYPEDPELYKRFADKLEETLKKYKENWEVILQELYNLREDIAQGRDKEKDIGLDKQKEMPFFGILVQEIYEKKNYEELSEEEIDLLKSITKRILSLIEEEINIVDFWENDTKQRSLRSQINLHLITINQSAFQGISEGKQKFLKQSLNDKRSLIAQRILETAYHVYGASHGKR